MKKLITIIALLTIAIGSAQTEIAFNRHKYIGVGQAGANVIKGTITFTDKVVKVRHEKKRHKKWDKTHLIEKLSDNEYITITGDRFFEIQEDSSVLLTGTNVHSVKYFYRD